MLCPVTVVTRNILRHQHFTKITVVNSQCLCQNCALTQGFDSVKGDYNQTILQTLEVIQRSINNIQVEQEPCQQRVDRVERKKPINPSQSGNGQVPLFCFSDRHDENNVASSVNTTSGHSIADFQREFEIIKDSVIKVKLPNELKLLESKSGIKRPDQSHLDTLTKCARFTETALKLLASLDEQYLTRIPELSKLYTVFAAQMNYLQSEYASLVVKGQFDSETANLFKSLEKNNNQLKGETLDNVRADAEISAAKTRVRGD